MVDRTQLGGAAMPTVPEVLPLVRRFAQMPGNETGGHLHLVLDDGNVKDHHVRYCLAEAESAGDTLAAEVARTLLTLSKTQRSKVAAMFYDLQRDPT
jgi:hypothetical protein